MKIACDICQMDMKEPGALIFTPPNIVHRVIKVHVCVKCWKVISDEFRITEKP